MTRKKIVAICLAAMLVVAMLAAVQGSQAISHGSMVSVSHTSRILLDEIPTPTPTLGAGTNSPNPSGGGNGGG